MPLPKHLGAPKPLGYFVDRLDQLPPSGWLYVRAGTKEINLATECYPVEVDSRDVSEEEMVSIEANWKAGGFNSFLSDDQIRDIISNLERQRADFMPADLARAVNFYWRHDAFIVLDRNVA